MPTKKLKYTELVKKAKEKGVPFYGKTRAELEIALKEEDPSIFVIDRAADFTHEQLLDMERKNEVVPGKIIGYKKDRDIIEEYLSYNPDAFNGCDLTNPRNHTQHIFGTRKVECYCGEKFRIERKYAQRIGGGFGVLKKGEPKKIIVEDTITRNCPNCGRKWVYHDMQTAKAATGKYVDAV